MEKISLTDDEYTITIVKLMDRMRKADVSDFTISTFAMNASIIAAELFSDDVFPTEYKEVYNTKIGSYRYVISMGGATKKGYYSVTIIDKDEVTVNHKEFPILSDAYEYVLEYISKREGKERKCKFQPNFVDKNTFFYKGTFFRIIEIMHGAYKVTVDDVNDMQTFRTFDTREQALQAVIEYIQLYL